MQEFRFVMATVATIAIRLPDGTVHEHPGTTTPMEIALGIGSRLAKAVVAAEVNGRVVDANRPLAEVAGETTPASFRC